MRWIFREGDLSPFLSYRKQAEREIRAECTEYAILQTHKKLYTPTRDAIGPIRDAVVEAVAKDMGCASPGAARSGHRRFIDELRALLNRGATERALQNALIDILGTISFGVGQEVPMPATGVHRGMRMDVCLPGGSDGPPQVIELKRGSHLLLARRGRPTERISRQLIKAVKQLQAYGHRIEFDAATRERVEERLRFQILQPELRLIAGRELSSSDEYSLLTKVESSQSTSGFQLQVYTWDGLLAELERIVD